MSWNEEKVNKLKELWGKGNTASQIAEIIGGISRNAVIGKAHRLNLSAKIKTRAATSSQNFERRDITIGLSDGIKVEILDGLEMTDKIKIWNKTEPIKIEPEESAFDQFDD